MKKCTGMQMVGKQCLHSVMWRNRNGVEVCEYHKLLLDGFNWEIRDKREWVKLASC